MIVIPMPFGRYKGEDLRDIPSDYLLWALQVVFTRALRHDIQRELLRRAVVEAADHRAQAGGVS